MSADQISAFVMAWLEEHLGQPVSAEADFAALGLDSLDAVRFIDALAARLGREDLPVATLLAHPSIPALAAHLATPS